MWNENIAYFRLLKTRRNMSNVIAFSNADNPKVTIESADHCQIENGVSNSTV